MDWRVAALRRDPSDRYDRILDMFEAEYETAPIDVRDDGTRVYQVEALDGGLASKQLAAMLDRVHLTEWAQCMIFEAEPL